MFLFALGIFLGIFLSMITFLTISAFSVSFDINFITNFIIALATTIAACIHYDSQKQLKRNRIWEINQGLLLELTEALATAIQATENSIHNMNSCTKEYKPVERDSWENLRMRVSYALTVYKPLMDDNLIIHIEHYKRIDDDISKQVDYLDKCHLTAYQESLVALNDLYSEMNVFISDISGIKKH